MSECLAQLLEGDDDNRLECRRSLNACIERLKNLDLKLCLEIDGQIATLINEYSGIFFTAGYVVGQAFDVTDPEAVKEINLLRKELKEIIPFWPKEKAPGNRGDEDVGAFSE